MTSSPVWHPFTQHGLGVPIPHVSHAKGAALEIADATGDYLSELGPRLLAHFARQNILLRPLGNTVYVMPPFCTAAADLNMIYDAIISAVI